MVNPYNLVTFLKGQSEITMSEIICKVTQGVGPIRNPKSKYHVSVGEYKDDYYPPYCQGMYHYHTYFKPQNGAISEIWKWGRGSSSIAFTDI